MTTPADFLAGVRVLELGDGVAGSSATSILWSLGAEVTAVVDPTSPHRRGRPQLDGVSLLARSLDRGKQLEDSADPARFDVVVADRVLRPRGVPADIGAYVDWVEAHNRRAWVTISAFGLTGERAEDGATELTVAAASGMLSAVRDPSSGRPLKLAGQQSLLNTGQAAALAACHALDLASERRRAHLDLSAVEATLAMGPVLEVGALLLETGSLGGAKRYGSPADFYRCTDGLVRISAMEDHQWQGVVVAMDSPPWTERFATVESRIKGADEVDEHVAAWTATRTKVEAETVLQANGVPATAVYSPAEILASPQLTHREAFEPLPLGEGHEARVVGRPFRLVAGGDGERRRRSLQGLRVLEASRVLAVPLCGAILGTLGAEVTKLEDLPRLDMYRRRGPFIEATPGPERGAYFALMNHSKASAAFDADADREQLTELVGAADVVIENLGAKRANALGLGPSIALRDHADLLAMSSSGFGLDGPHAGHRAYAYNLQASCALGYLTRTEDGESAEIDIAWADLIAAYSLATIVAAWAVGPEGNAGAGLDFAMADLVVAHFNEAVAAASLGLDADDEDRANELSPFAPNGVHPTGDGWLALSVEDDDQFDRLVKVLGLDAVERGNEIDAALDAATSTHSAAELAEELRAAGVMAEACAGPADLIASPQLASRGLFGPVVHEDWGERRLVGIPWRPYGEPALPLTTPPTLIEEG
jgi:crotonobetainyl-CoA:carnitine CoA-transferase CaiB-like acyl-CoA transferase